MTIRFIIGIVISSLWSFLGGYCYRMAKEDEKSK